MSITASNLCWQLPESVITKTEKFVLLSLVKYLGDNEVRAKPTSASCYPSIDKICRNTNMSRRHTIRMLKALQVKHLIKIEKRKERSSVYHIMLCNIHQLLKINNSIAGDVASVNETTKSPPSDFENISEDKMSPITSTNHKCKNNKLSSGHENAKESDNRSEKMKRKAVRDSLRDIEDTDW